MDERASKASWWTTLPGILTAIAGFITAVTGLIVALQGLGLLPSPSLPAQTQENKMPTTMGNPPTQPLPSQSSLMTPLPAPPQPTPHSAATCQALPPFSDPDNVFDSRTRQFIPSPNVPRLPQPTTVRFSYDEGPKSVWTGFLAAATKISQPPISGIIIVVIIGNKLGFQGLCKIGEEFSVDLNGRSVIGRVTDSNDFGVSVSFREGF